jgi:tetratricopeptide (TPR) repeat protein
MKPDVPRHFGWAWVLVAGFLTAQSLPPPAVHVERQELETRIQAHKQTLARNPKDATTHNLLGILYQRTDRLFSAQKEYETALRLNPKCAEAWNNLGALWQTRGSYRKAVDSYRRALALKPDLVVAHKNLGTAYLSLKKVDEGLAAYEEAYRLDPTSFDATPSEGVPSEGVDPATYHYCLAKVYASTGQAELALQSLQKALAAGLKERDQIRKDPAFKGLREDARFQELLK